VDEYVILKTERQTTRATAEHPFYVGHGTFKTLDILKAGDAIYAREGLSLSEQRIVSIKEVLPPARGEKLSSEENVDEDSSTGQMQWYYRQTRAN
jgi:sortase (surface protein transpeptidase)